MSLLLFILFGFVVGLLARAIMPGRQHMGFIMTTLLGVAGSFVGGLVASLIAGESTTYGVHTAGLLGSILGAILLLAVFGGVISSGRRRHSIV